ncbi:hypothetical protein [Lampropedia aestuarii]|uniref:hypothetical protein n=1 Tax=Lampropedia aestuarii TaxID=2562762 RepID=UPI0024688BEB|nr:hypothetical protein [Lampropedia aestuarii]MDH5856056.1 hypothetical protein [Lampropedia aestuarii]
MSHAVIDECILCRYQGIKLQQMPAVQRHTQVGQSEELRLLKVELQRGTEERDILKKAVSLATSQIQVRIHRKKISLP